MAENEFVQDSIRYVASKVAAKKVGLSSDYISRFCRDGLVLGTRHNGSWYINEGSLDTYLKSQAAEQAARNRELSAAAKEDVRRVQNEQQQAQRPATPPPPPVTSPIHRAPLARTRASKAVFAQAIAALILFVSVGAAYAFADLSALSAIKENAASARSQLAASASWFDALAEKVYDTVCPYFSDCEVDLAAAPRQPIPQRPMQAQAPSISPPAPEVPRIQQPVQQTVVNQPIIERVTETVRSVISGGITKETLEARLAAITQDFENRFELISSTSFRQNVIVSDSISAAGGGENLTIEASSWTGGTITKAAISGGSITGATISGTISAVIDTATALISDLTANTIVATNVTFTNSMTTNATTTNLAVTGTAKIGSATGILQTTSGVVSSIALGADGQILKIVAGLPTWATDLSGGGGGASAWATTSNDLAIVESDPSDVVVIGASATTTTGNILEVAGNSLVRGIVTAYNVITAPRFTATSSQASQFPYASSTALTISGTAYIGSLNGPLDARNGVVSATSSISVLYGGTGLTAAPTYGQLLVGNSSGGYTLAATSSLGLESPLTFSSPLSRVGNTVSISTAGDWSGTLGGFSVAQLVAASFSTTSANYWQTTRNFFSTTSADYWETEQTARSADDLTNNSIEDLNDVAAISENFGDLFAWNGAAWADVATSTLSIALSDTTGTLGATRGGTGLSSVAAAGILLGNYAGTGWQQLATSTLGLLTTNVAEGGNLYYTNARVQTYLDAIDKGFFFSTTSAQYFASVTDHFSTTSAIYFAHSSTTIPKTYASNIFTGSNVFSSLTLGALNGPLHANAGALSATTSIGVLYGGTGLISAPTYGQLLVGNASGGYTLTATSSLGITGSGTVGSGTTGQFPYYPGAGTTLTATSSLFIAASGNIGIGATTPDTPLHVAGSGEFTGVFATLGTQNNERYMKFGTMTGGDGNSRPYVQGYFSNSDANVWDFLINPQGGNVGIGTTTPGTKFDVWGDARADNGSLISRNNGTGNGEVKFYDTTDGGGAWFAQDGTTYLGSINSSGNWTANRIVVDSSGNVGIGGASSGPKLRVFTSSNNAAFLTSSDASVQTVVGYNDNESFTGAVLFGGADRSNSSAYQLLFLQSDGNGTPDTEACIRGDGSAFADGSWSGGGADYAEWVTPKPGTTPTDYPKGSLVCEDFGP